MSEQKTPITVAHGDGIGPEVMRATLTCCVRTACRSKSSGRDR